MNKEKLDLAGLVKKFEIHNRSENLSPRTVQWYKQALGLFQAWLESEGMSTCVDDLGEEEVRLFILHLQQRPGLKGPASSHTVNNRVRAIKSFFNWLYRKGHTECHRLEDVKTPKARQLEIEILTAGEIEKIFDSINSNTVMGARNTAILTLMLDTGLRLSEVVTLKYDDVHLDSRYVKVLGKGDKERIVAFGASCQKALNNYAQHYRIENEGQEADVFFLCIDGHPLTPDGLRSLTTRLSKSSGVRRLHPHLTRHTYATRFLLNGGNVFLLQQNMGHTSLTMVQKYVHIAARMAAQESRSYSPMDALQLKGARRYQHRFNGDDWHGKIYPNAGRAKGKANGKSPRKR